MLRRNRAAPTRFVAILVVSSWRFIFAKDQVVQTSYTFRDRTTVNVEAPNQFGPYEAKALLSRVSPRLPSQRRVCAFNY